MDPFVHGTISALGAVKKTGWTKKVLPFVFFGVIPDLYGICTLTLVVLGFRSSLLDDFFFVQYPVTHSIFVFLVLWIIVSVWLKRIYWPFVMYGLHILTDLASHRIYGTPWLWPFIDTWFKGPFEYTDPKVLLMTYVIMLPVWGFIVLNKVIKKN